MTLFRKILFLLLILISLLPITTAMFTQPDSIIQSQYNPQDLNHYMFVRGNPYKNIDPDGKAVVTITGGVPNINEPSPNPQFIAMAQQFNPNEPVRHFTVGASYEEVRGFFQEQGGNQPVQIVGHSWGGSNALEYANRLEAEGIDVDNLITIDPYKRHLRFGDDEDISPAEALTSGIKINLFQTNPAGVGSRGYPKGNMLNLDVGSMNNNVRNLDHYTLMQNQYVQNVVSGTVNAVYDQSVRKNWARYGGGGGGSSISQRVHAIKTYGSSGFQKLARSYGLI